MRKTFSGYYKLGDTERSEFWEKAFIAFDANALLNLYRYLPSTSNAFHEVLERLSHRLWMPYQAASEYHRNRTGVVAKQTQRYLDTAKEARVLLDRLDAPRNHPFVDRVLLENVTKYIKELATSLEKTGKERDKLLTDDPNLDKLTTVFDGKIGIEPTTDELEALHDIAKLRIENKTPPGYQDANKDEVNSYGDALIWIQLLEEAKSRNSPAIFVTDDAKEDWWRIVKGKTIGPRPELVKEFVDKTGNAVLIVRPHVFLKEASDYLGLKTEKSTFEEIRAVSRQEAERKRIYAERRHEREEVRSIARHAGKHSQHIERCLNAIDLLPLDYWEQLDSPMDLPLEVYEGILNSLRECPCVADIVMDIDSLSPRQWRTNMRKIEPSLVEHLERLRRLPRNAKECISTLSMGNSAVNNNSEDRYTSGRLPFDPRRMKRPRIMDNED